jgi:inorganic triphosphatase YgiF
VSTPRVEAELKYIALDERPLRELERAEWLGPARLGVLRTVHELDRYLDTADLRLAALRWACRLRSRQRRTVVSLKGPAEHAPGDLVHRRPELEGPADASLDAPGWPPSAARDRLLDMSGGAPLNERFRLEQERSERDVRLGETRIGLLSLDRVGVLLGGRTLGQLLVVEVEFDEGHSGLAAAPIADALGRLDGLEPDPSSKLERALAMLPRD